jgi:hypothetical protein
MFVWKKRLDRRTFLRGVGATVALPLLDAMVPARALLASGAAPVTRLAFVYFPLGAVMAEWTPATARHDLPLGRILVPLAPFRNRLTIVSGLENRHAYGPVHAITPGTWLSGTSPRESGELAHGATADQLAAEHLGQDTLLPSMTVATEEPRKIGAGIWEGTYDESYGTTISFRRARVPVPVEFRPRAVFDTLFGCAAGADRAGVRGPRPASVLDVVAADAAGLRARLGPADRVVLGDYLDTVRDVERRVQEAERRVSPEADRPADVSQRFVDRMRLMFDMTALAFRADITRVASIMMAAETSTMTYDHLGVPEAFHLLSHHQNDSDKIDKLVRIQAFHTDTFATFVRALAELPDGDGSILDRSLILFGSNMSSSHAHDHFPLPLAVVGGACGRFRGGQHLHCPDRTPLSNLLLTVLRRAGVPLESIGDSTGECVGL